jgi:hypothetical protein
MGMYVAMMIILAISGAAQGAGDGGEDFTNNLFSDLAPYDSLPSIAKFSFTRYALMIALDCLRFLENSLRNNL